jgi:hypothetical protein
MKQSEWTIPQSGKLWNWEIINNSHNKKDGGLCTYVRTYAPTHLPTCLPTYPTNHPPTYLPTYLRIYLPTCLPTYPPNHPPTYLTHPLTYPPTYLPYPPTYLPTYPTCRSGGPSHTVKGLSPPSTLKITDALRSWGGGGAPPFRKVVNAFPRVIQTHVVYSRTMYFRFTTEECVAVIWWSNFDGAVAWSEGAKCAEISCLLQVGVFSCSCVIFKIFTTALKSIS